MDRFVLDRGRVPDARMQPSRVVPVDPSGGREHDTGGRPVRPGVEGRRANALDHVEPVRRFDEGVVVRVPDGPDGCGDVLSANLSVSFTDVNRLRVSE